LNLKNDREENRIETYILRFFLIGNREQISY